MSEKKEETNVPDNFSKVANDFLNDIGTTYPEHSEKLEHIRKELNENDETLFEYCKTIYPERFFDILYQNEDIFKDESKNLNFLPNIDFHELWSDEISNNTKEIIWKYLQLILFMAVGDVDDTKFFGETSKLFEAIDEDVLKSKLEETIKEMGNMFNVDEHMKFESEEFQEQMKNMKETMGDDLPNPEDLHNHLSGLLDGKLGNLATEIAEETARELDLDIKNTENMSDVFQKLFKNPGKLINMVKKVGNKIEEKIKSGEIKESELMEEAQELMTKMKSMPGMKNFQNMFEKMGMPKGGKVNMGQFNSRMNNNIKAKQRERMLQKLKKKQEEKCINTVCIRMIV